MIFKGSQNIILLLVLKKLKTTLDIDISNNMQNACINLIYSYKMIFQWSFTELNRYDIKI